MSRPADPQAMAPRKPGSTRTAPPTVPDDFWTRPRMLTYLLFDATGIVYLLVGLVALRVAWALAGGAPAWDALMKEFASPGYVIFHLLALIAALFVGVRFFRLFPKAQPAQHRSGEAAAARRSCTRCSTPRGSASPPRCSSSSEGSGREGAAAPPRTDHLAALRRRHHGRHAAASRLPDDRRARRPAGPAARRRALVRARAH